MLSKTLLAEVTSWGPLMFSIGLAMVVLSIILHNALSGEWFWDLGYAPSTAERVWTYRTALVGLVLVIVGLILAVIHDEVQRVSSRLHTVQ